MKGDFSRIRFNSTKQYTAVLDYQGRVSLDADANEQRAIDGHLRKTEAVDVIGEYGAPSNDAGFAITVDQNEILIGAGRYYVEGLMCENRQDGLPYGNQPYLIEPSPADSALLNELAQQGGAIHVFLQVWQRLVTALDDPCLREPALGLADTTGRLQTVWRVAAALVQSQETGPKPGGTRPVGSRVPVVATPRAGTARNASQLALKKMPAASALAAKRNPALFTRGGSSAAPEPSAPAQAKGPAPDCCAQMYAETLAASTGAMAAMTSGGTSDCSCQPIPAAGYHGLENQLYRVDIHQPGDETTATFKWSRENASVVAAIQSMSGPTIWVDSLGPDANLGFQANEWVEIGDDTNLFGQTPNQPGTLYQIQSVNHADSSISLTTPAILVDSTRNARVRRWDHSGPAAGTLGLPLQVNNWLTLENGIQVSFAPGTYQSGDYWTIPARTASGLIDWPPCGSNGNLFHPPRSIIVTNAPLACIHWDATKGQAVVEDCRRIFSPLTALIPPPTSPALHITNYSWQNDDITTFDALLNSGLTVTLDAAPTGPISGANFIVTVESFNGSILSGSQEFAAFSARSSVPSAAAGAVPSTAPAATSKISDIAVRSRQPYTGLLETLPLSVAVLDWQTSIKATAMQIAWQVPATDLTGVQSRYLQFINDRLLGGLAEFGIYARVRVKLLGDAIFAQSGAALLAESGVTSFLDGQSFGVAATRQDNQTLCIALQMPSGNGEKASNFEGWFYLAPFNSVSQVTTNYAAYTVVVDSADIVTGVQAGTPPQTVTPQASVQLNFPSATAAGVTVNLSLSAVTAGVNAGSYVSLGATSLTVFPNVSPAFTSGTVNINVFGNPGAGQTYTFQITASVALAYGTPVAQSVTFTLTGVQGNTGIIYRVP